MRSRVFPRWRALGVAAALAWASAGGAALVPLLPAAAAAQTSDVVLEGVRLAFGDIVYRAPRAEFRGTPLSRAELTRLLDATAPEPLAERVGKLRAASIVMPEIVSEVTTPQGRQVTTYRDAAFTDVGGGRIGSVTAAGGTIETTDAKGVARGGFGRFSIAGLDLGLAIGLFTTSGGPEAPLRQVYGDFSLDALTLTDPSGVATRVGRISGRDLSARPTRAGWIGTVNELAAAPDLKAASAEDRKRSLDALAELLDAFAIGTMEATDITFGAPDAESGGGRIGRVAFTGATGARAAEMRVDGFEAGSKDSRVRFASLSYGGLSMKPILEGLRDFGASPDGKPSPAALRRLLPLLGDVSLSGLDMTLPDSKERVRTAPAQPMQVAFGQIAFAADKPVDGVPSDLRLALRNVSFRVPPNPTNDGLKQLASLGYDRVDTSLVLSLGWNEAGQELVVRELSLDGADMGGAILRAVVGNMSRDVFNPDSAIASVAALGATARSAEIAIENRGLFERLIAREAKRQKRNPEDIRREYGMAAAVGIPAILGNSAGAKTLAQAVARFVAKPGRLVVKARARSPAGYGIADFSAGPDPASIFEALEITATAE